LVFKLKKKAAKTRHIEIMRKGEAAQNIPWLREIRALGDRAEYGKGYLKPSRGF